MTGVEGRIGPGAGRYEHFYDYTDDEVQMVQHQKVLYPKGSNIRQDILHGMSERSLPLTDACQLDLKTNPVVQQNCGLMPERL